MSNAVVLPFEADMELVIAADNSGSIGEKEADVLQTPNTIVGQFACRVALMECLAEYAEPRAVIMQNFTDDAAWLDYKAGVLEVLEEAGFHDLPITGSTESNFISLQSGLGLTIVGTRKKRRTYEWTGKEGFAVIGQPFVGEAVLKNRQQIPDVALLKQFVQTPGVKAILPVGSKGISHAFRKWTNKEIELESELDLETSAGPATCFIIAFDEDKSEKVRELAPNHFYMLFNKI
jgi:hypothetical protein